MRSRFCLLTGRTLATPWQESLEPEPTFLTVLKSKESAVSQEEEGEEQGKQSFPLQEGGWVTTVRPGCAQARMEGCPTLDRGVCVPKEPQLWHKTEALFPVGPCPHHRPLPTKTQGAVHSEAAQPRLSFLTLGPSASKALGVEGR